MDKTRAVVFWTGGIVVVVAVAVAAIIVVSRPWAWNGTLKAAEYSQSQAVRGFDDSSHVQTGQGQLQKLQRVLSDDGWHPGDTEQAKAGCVGGVTTHLLLTLADGTQTKLTTYLCGGSNDALTKNVTALISSWRASNG